MVCDIQESYGWWQSNDVFTLTQPHHVIRNIYVHNYTYYYTGSRVWSSTAMLHHPCRWSVCPEWRHWGSCTVVHQLLGVMVMSVSVPGGGCSCTMRMPSHSIPSLAQHCHPPPWWKSFESQDHSPPQPRRPLRMTMDEGYLQAFLHFEV